MAVGARVNIQDVLPYILLVKIVIPLHLRTSYFHIRQGCDFTQYATAFQIGTVYIYISFVLR